ncbi:pirin family protein [Elongatibacter sediminis]|uniref:Pirin family protein n=1 Tax=Elongatibacter sediminis TaxID=3119006 RepID=A0AAW9RC13_9GAMM
MSRYPDRDPECTEATHPGPVELTIRPRDHDLGGFSVRRVLPAPRRRMVGPFIFFDHMGPAEFPPGEGIQVRPHPHIGLATVTYLFEGEIMHRDSLGFVQPIRAGAVNLMTAGSGIVHSERAGDDVATTSRLHGIQSWMALPDGLEECDPGFIHYAAKDLPEFSVGAATVRLIMGEAWGQRSPVHQHSPTLYLECRIPAGAELDLEPAGELAVYVVAGAVTTAPGGQDSDTLDSGTLGVARAGTGLSLKADADAHVMVIGGSPVGERHIWWNYVSGSRERIEKAKSDWRDGRFDKVPGDDEFIPLPD